jgi:hypothetical protein
MSARQQATCCVLIRDVDASMTGLIWCGSTGGSRTLLQLLLLPFEQCSK